MDNLMARQFLSVGVSNPSEIDAVTDSLGISPHLINIYLSSVIDFTKIGLGVGVYMPIQISKKEGGRKSLYYLRPGEKVLCGIFIASNNIYLRYVTRETGVGLPARSGDSYIEEYRDINGKMFIQIEGLLNIIDEKHGHGELVNIRLRSDSSFIDMKGKWWAWSFYAEF